MSAQIHSNGGLLPTPRSRSRTRTLMAVVIRHPAFTGGLSANITTHLGPPGVKNAGGEVGKWVV